MSIIYIRVNIEIITQFSHDDEGHPQGGGSWWTVLGEKALKLKVEITIQQLIILP